MNSSSVGSKGSMRPADDLRVAMTREASPPLGTLHTYTRSSASRRPGSKRALVFPLLSWKLSEQNTLASDARHEVGQGEIKVQ